MSGTFVVISNVPRFAIVSDTGVLEEVTYVHIFDTVFLIDRSVRRVTSLGDDSYEVVCDEPGWVKAVLDGKKIGQNIISVEIREKRVRHYLELLHVVFLFLFFVLFFSCENNEVYFPPRSSTYVPSMYVNTSVFE